MERKTLTLGVVFIIYFGLMAVLMWDWEGGTVWFLIGGLLGLSFVLVDRIIYVFLTKPHEHLSEHVKHMMKEGRYFDALRLLRARSGEQRQLTVRSVFFMGAWIPAALFVVTSTASMMALGFVMGIGLHMLYDVMRDVNDMSKLKQWLFWPIKREVKNGEAKAVVGLYGLFFLVLSLMII